MSIDDGYAWFVALVWPDGRGIPTARIHEWDRQSGQVGKMVESFTYGSGPTFYDVLQAKYYEAVDGLLERPVADDGVLVALRRETVPVPVPVYR